MPNIIQTLNVVIAGEVLSCYRCNEQLSLTSVVKFDAVSKKIYYHCLCGNNGWRSFDATIAKVNIDIDDIWCDQRDADAINVVGMTITVPSRLPSVVDVNDHPIDSDPRDDAQDQDIYGFDNDESTHIEDDESVNDPDSEA